MTLPPIVTPMQMKQTETRAFKARESELAYMEKAGEGIALEVETSLITPNDAGVIYLLVGKGNNGGDALCAGSILIQKRYRVIAFCLYKTNECSPLSKKMAARFKKAGGQLIEIFEAPEFDEGIILDGLVGTGFQGKADGLLAQVIEKANKSGLPIFAVDIPSGLNGETGEVAGVAIEAETTLYLGYPKTGFFLGKGWDHIGKLVEIDFGMDTKFSEDLVPQAFLMTEERASSLFPKIVASRHKYQAGYVLAAGGSQTMPGAAILSCLASLRAGAGMVRLFHPPKMEAALSSAPYELIREEWDLMDPSRFFEEEKRAGASLIGPGMGRDETSARAFEKLLEQIAIPVVLDADALFFLSKRGEKFRLPEQVIVTPHRGEMERLLGGETITLARCQSYANEKRVTVILKGAPTIVFSPQTTPTVIPQGDPGMATAGTGDVLTGVVAAFLAQGLDPHSAALLAATVHGIAGEEAADVHTSYGVIASDLIHFISEAIGILTKKE